MFCPKCAAQNAENASFCRACGANISLVPQALTGQLAVADEDRLEGGKRRRNRRDKEKSPPTLEKGVENLFTGVAFVLISLAVMRFMPGGHIWWFWMLIPAFGYMGSGVGTLLRIRNEKHSLAPPPDARASVMPPAAHVNELPPRNTSDFYGPPPTSVTEGTTRHLGAPVERAPKDV